MEFTTIQIIIFFVGIIIISILLSYVIMRFLGDKRDYDERQIYERARTFKAALYVMCMVEMLISCIEVSGNKLPSSFSAIQTVVLFLVISGMSSYLLWKDALWSLSTNRLKDTAIVFMVSLILLIAALVYRSESTTMALRISAAISGILMLVLSIEMFIKIKHDAHEEEED